MLNQAQNNPGIATVTTILEHKAFEAIAPLYSVMIRLAEEGVINPEFLNNVADKVTVAVNETMAGLRDAYNLDDFIVDLVLVPINDWVMWDADDVANWLCLAGIAHPIVQAITGAFPDMTDRIASVLEELHRKRSFDKETVHPGVHHLHTVVAKMYGAFPKPFYESRGKKWMEVK